MINLTGQHIMIVGGSRGIGAACAEMAAAAGADVSITYQKAEKAAASVVEKIKSKGVKGLAVKADAANEQDMAAAMDTVSSELGVPQGIVISASIYQKTTNFENMSIDVWNDVTRTNITGTFISAKAYVRRALGHDIKGSIVIITSVSGQAGAGYKAAYGTSKGAQIALMKSIASELGPRGIRVNCVAPAWTETEMITDDTRNIGLDRMIQSFPLKKIGQPIDVAGAVTFLLSDLAGHITGTTLVVDGGMTMR